MTGRRDAPPGCLAQVLGFLAAFVGGGVIVLTVLTSAYGEREAVPAPGEWSGGRLHLHTASRDLQTCRISPENAPAYDVVVPYADNEFWAGVRVEPAAGTTTRLRCSGAVLATSGPLLALYPLAENDFWVIAPAALLASIGIVYGRPFDQRRPPT